MALLETSSSKSSYTRAQDETIIKMRKEGKSIEEISAAVKHSPASIQYRIQRVLTKHDSFDTIKYKGAAAAVVAAPAEAKGKAKSEPKA